MKRFLLILLTAALSGLAILMVGLTGFALAENVSETIQPDSYGALTRWEDYIFLGVFLMCIPTGVYALIVSITLACSRGLRASRLRAWGFSLLLTLTFIAGISLWAGEPWKNGFADLQYLFLPLSWNLSMLLSGIAGTEVALQISRRTCRSTPDNPNLPASEAPSGL